MALLHIGFTGTRRGMTEEQKAQVKLILNSLAGTLHHGDCIGADAEAHEIARSCGLNIVVHPPEIDTLRAWCLGDFIHPARPYLTRNREIVMTSEVMICCPKEAETRRSGTWATIRKARAEKKKGWIVWPNGEIEKLTEGEET